MSSILSAQNLQTLRRRNIGRRCPCALSPPFLSPRPRPPPPERPCPNAMLNLHPFVVIVVVGIDLAAHTALARLSLWRQPAFHAAALRLGLALRAGALDDLLLFIDAHDQMAHDLIHHLETAIQLLDQLAAPVDDLEDIHAFLMAPYLVRELAASPDFGLFELSVHPRHDGLD